jgi:hypothetical protein
MEATKYIPVEKWNLWYELFKSSGNGRLKCQPFMGKDEVLVSYLFTDMHCCNEFHREYHRLTTQIKEVNRKVSLWNKIKKYIRG